MGDGDGVEDRVLTWLGARQERARPCVHGQQSKETERGACGGEKLGKGGDVGRRNGRGGSWAVEQGVEACLELGRLGFDVGEDVEGVVEGAEEGGQPTGGCQESARRR